MEDLEDRLLGVGREQLKRFHSHYRVALRIEARAPDGNRLAVWINGDDSSSDTTLSRETYEV